MFRCKIINFLFSSIPLNKWKDFLIRRHIQECPVCQKRYVSALEAKSLLIEESEIESVPDFWLGLESRLAEPEKKEKDLSPAKLSLGGCLNSHPGGDSREHLALFSFNFRKEGCERKAG